MSKERRHKHIHKYHKNPDTGLWHCAFPGCYHFMPKNVESSVRGRESICWECNGTFILDEHNMKDSEPVCEQCSPESKAIQAYLAEKEGRTCKRCGKKFDPDGSIHLVCGECRSKPFNMASDTEEIHKKKSDSILHKLLGDD